MAHTERRSVKLIKSTLKVPAKLTLTPESVAQQKALLEAASTVTLPTNATEQQYAVSVGQDLRRHLKETESDRKALVAPALEWQRLVNKLSKEHCAPIETALQQIEGRVNEFQKAETERVRLEEVARAEELKRLQAPVETTGDVAQQEIAAYRQEQQAEELLRAPLPEPVKASGAATRKDLGWECTDPIALWNARPDLCHPPTPKASAIRAVCVPELPVVGLKLWWETNTSIRTR
jgi:hypothetical protein